MEAECILPKKKKNAEILDLKVSKIGPDLRRHYHFIIFVIHLCPCIHLYLKDFKIQS